MYINKLVYTNLINLRNASRVKKSYVDVYINTHFLKILNFLYFNGYIFGFLYNTKYQLRIFLNVFDTKNLLAGLSFAFTKSNFKFRYLKFLYRSSYLQTYLYYFSTVYGFLTLEEIFKRNLYVGGILYFYIKSF